MAYGGILDGKEGPILVKAEEGETVIIPEGFTVVSASFEGENVNALQQDASGQQAFCVTDGKEAKLFLYSGEDGKFTPLELVQISETAYIILLRDDGGAEVPKGFKEATLTYNDQEFPDGMRPISATIRICYPASPLQKKHPREAALWVHYWISLRIISNRF